MLSNFHNLYFCLVRLKTRHVVIVIDKAEENLQPLKTYKRTTWTWNQSFTEEVLDQGNGLSEEGLDHDDGLCEEGLDHDTGLCEEGLDQHNGMCEEGLDHDDGLCEEGLDHDYGLCEEGLDCDNSGLLSKTLYISGQTLRSSQVLSSSPLLRKREIFNRELKSHLQTHLKVFLLFLFLFINNIFFN